MPAEAPDGGAGDEPTRPAQKLPARQMATQPAEPSAEQLSGPDLVRAALSQAKAQARAKGVTPGPARRRTRSASTDVGGDARDPVRFGAAVRRLVQERGWDDVHANARVIAHWDELVGPDIASHCRPASLVDGQLVLVAESTAWATQLTLIRLELLRSLSERVGSGVVRVIDVRGPSQPDWRRGPRRVQGRGPRDTYG